MQAAFSASPSQLSETWSSKSSVLPLSQPRVEKEPMWRRTNDHCWHPYRIRRLDCGDLSPDNQRANVIQLASS
ncbi:hypothetical protein PISMIDRAFT_686468 [Pisolithus microcarpus 441]|uniref:Unplaced genomic scaffold scaffold_317, whole genome shotgun sequence n=1 Tax=Pisolithus microcarpus 441 TaxID=765257 RepID=A0A0C9XLV7_9AGAM|nr:hypothetical protein PISMIDRAFT_688696 [Pisolithus microcarpus 441]KIK16293.1 hypothetical protein PISMIDRAFT_686468 [Pisolithus microcarpus 441]